MNELRLVVPLIPPSCGHYNRYRVVTPRRGKPFVQVYPTEEAKAWWSAVAAVNAGRLIRGLALEVQYVVFLPDRRRRDTDNFAKCIFDALTKCGAIEDDSLIDDFHGHRRYDALNPRTVIIVKSPQEQFFEK